MKKFNYVLGIMLLGLFASCGGVKSDPNSVTLTVEPQLEELGEYITIANPQVTVSLVDEKEEGVDVRSIQSSMPINVTKSVESNYRFALEVAVLDENHEEISSLPNYVIESEFNRGNDGINYVLSVGTNSAQMKASQEVSEWKDEDQQMWDKIRTQGKYIVVRPYYSSAEYSAVNSPSSESNSAVAENEDDSEENVTGTEEIEETVEVADNSASTDNSAVLSEFNQALEEYKSLTKEAIVLSKKVKAGDKNANVALLQKSAECTKLSTKIVSLANKLNDPSLLAKYQKINNEYLQGLN